MAFTSVLVSTFPPFSTLSFHIPSETLSNLPDLISDRLQLDIISHDLVLSRLGGGPFDLSYDQLESLREEEEGAGFVCLRLSPRLLGGKGGFGSQLRAAGGRMSSQRTGNTDACRDLNGRRLSTVKEAKKIAQYIDDEPLRKKVAQEATKAKLEALERQLGISSDPGSSSASGAVDKGKAPEPVAGKKHRFDDTAYLEESETIVDNVKNAVTAALLKKRKKAKTEANTDSASASATAKPSESGPSAASMLAAASTSVPTPA